MHTSNSTLTRRRFLACTAAVAGARFCPAFGSMPDRITPQPYFAEVERAREALAKLGAPLLTADADQIAVLARQNDTAAVELAEKILDRYTLARLSLESDSTVLVVAGGAQRTLVEQGWRMFLIRLANPKGLSVNITVSAGFGAP